MHINLDKRTKAGFGRTELIVTIVVVLVLGTVGLAFMRGSKQVRVTDTCTANLKQLGVAMSMYTEANDRRLPYAFIHMSDVKQSTWDGLVGKYVQASLRTDANKPPPAASVVGQLLSCPLDKVEPLPFAVKYGFKRKTYTMPWHSMDTKNWPPATTNTTGVGLWWASYGKGNTGLDPVTNRLKGIALPSIRTDLILEPAHTMLLTEMARSNNISGNSSGGRIRYTGEQLETNVIPAMEYHGGKFNYLMMDGHVEQLFPEETVGPAGKTGSGWNTHFGIWSIRPGD